MASNGFNFIERWEGTNPKNYFLGPVSAFGYLKCVGQTDAHIKNKALLNDSVTLSHTKITGTA